MQPDDPRRAWNDWNRQKLVDVRDERPPDPRPQYDGPDDESPDETEMP